jgi:hypothetical protein
MTDKKKKIRASELARELGIGFKDLKEILISNSIAVKTAQSSFDEETAEKIRAIFKAKKEKIIQEQKIEESKKISNTASISSVILSGKEEVEP